MWLSFYGELKTLHVLLVLGSGMLFALRGVGVLAGQSWPMKGAVRHASYGVDTLLLCAGLSLWLMLGLNPLEQTWLGAKLVLLLVYIVLGSLALKRARTFRMRAVSFGAALACYAFMFSVARTHNPWGWWVGN